MQNGCLTPWNGGSGEWILPPYTVVEVLAMSTELSGAVDTWGDVDGRNSAITTWDGAKTW